MTRSNSYTYAANGNITYNLWGKVSTIWHYDQTDFYYYTAEYGPDLEKVSSRYDKTYHIEYEKFQWGDYEEKTTDGVTTSFYYVNGADGLAGLHTVSSTQGGTVTHSAAAITDHLGTITAMVDNNDWCYDVHYDVWGNRVINMPFYYSIERGFTGHDHIDGIGLIDMRGRMYDPHLGRFLSPDAFIQSPTDPQNYNRYSYCLNNPLKYTDPTGEIFGIDDIVVACVVAAVASAAIDYGTQVAFNYFNGYSGKDAWFKKIDFFDIAVSTTVGAVTAGYGAAAKAGTKIGKVGKWIVSHGNTIRNSEILLTSAVDITGEGVQDVTGEQFVSRMAVGLATQAVSDAVVKHSKSVKTDKLTADPVNSASRPNNLIDDEGGTVSVYLGIDEADEVKYVGITSREPEVRWKEHWHSNTPRSTLKYESVPNSFGLSMINGRIWEQNLINQYKLDNLYNKNNSISPSYWRMYNIK